MVGRISKQDYYTLLHTKYKSSRAHGFRGDFFSCISNYMPMADNDALGAGAGLVWTLGAWLAGFITMITIHCFTQNIKALGLAVSDKKIFSSTAQSV